MDETRKQSARGMVAESLSKAIAAIDHREDTAQTRDLRAKVLANIAVVKGWEVKRPTQRELSAMIADVEEIHRVLGAVGEGGRPRET